MTDEAIKYETAASRLGRVLVASSARGLCAVLLGDDDDALIEELRQRFQHARLEQAKSGAGKAMSTVLDLIERGRPPENMALDLRGTGFQLEVWAALQKIPAGQTISYAELARRLSRPKAARAVAQACGANPAAVVVPCHRVLAADGRLGGYRWGIGRKRALLEFEQAG